MFWLGSGGVPPVNKCWDSESETVSYLRYNCKLSMWHTVGKDDLSSNIKALILSKVDIPLRMTKLALWPLVENQIFATGSVISWHLLLKPCVSYQNACSSLRVRNSHEFPYISIWCPCGHLGVSFQKIVQLLVVPTVTYSTVAIGIQQSTHWIEYPSQYTHLGYLAKCAYAAVPKLLCQSHK